MYCVDFCRCSLASDRILRANSVEMGMTRRERGPLRMIDCLFLIDWSCPTNISAAAAAAAGPPARRATQENQPGFWRGVHSSLLATLRGEQRWRASCLSIVTALGGGPSLWRYPIRPSPQRKSHTMARCRLLQRPARFLGKTPTAWTILARRCAGITPTIAARWIR